MAIIVQSAVHAQNIDALNRYGVIAEAIPNGTAVTCKGQSPDAKQKFVFEVEKAGANAEGAWIVYSPEVVMTAYGDLEFSGLDVDVRHFVNKAGKPFDMFKPVPADLIQVDASFFVEGEEPTGAKPYVQLTADGFKATATQPAAGLAFKVFAKEDFVIGNGVFAGGEAVDAWIIECLAN